MSMRGVISLAAVAALGIAVVSADAFAQSAKKTRTHTVGPLAAQREAATGGAFNPYTHDYGGVNAGYAYGYDPTTLYGPCAGTSGNKIECSGQCWLNDNGTNYRWGECKAAKGH